jgi:hypothetical protein
MTTVRLHCLGWTNTAVKASNLNNVGLRSRERALSFLLGLPSRPMRVSPQGPDRLRAYANTVLGAIPSELAGMERAPSLQRSELSHKRSVTLELMKSEFLAKDKLAICARRVFHFDHPRAARGETQKATGYFMPQKNVVRWLRGWRSRALQRRRRCSTPKRGQNEKINNKVSISPLWSTSDSRMFHSPSSRSRETCGSGKYCAARPHV